MSIDENTKVEELAEALADGVNEETVAESAAEEQNLEEQMKAELEATVAASTEEIATEEQIEEQIEEQVTEEVAAETVEQAEEEPKKKGKFWKIFAIAAASLVVVLAGVYVGLSLHYADCFMYGTVVNGTDCSGKTVKEVEKMFQNQIESYTLTITGAKEYREEIKGTEIGIVYNGDGQLDKVFKKQNEFLWPKGLFKRNEIATEMKFEYDSEKLNERIAALECLKAENQVAPVAATVVYKDGQFEVQEETYGTQIEGTVLSESVIAAIGAFETTLNLEEKGCYVQPKFKKDSAEVIAARDEMNKYITANITYSFDEIVVTLDKNQISQWVTVDENMTPAISAAGVKAFAGTLSSKYNTGNRGGQLTTPRGKVVNMPLGGYGRVVGTEAEVNQIMAEIKEGKTVTREPIFSRKATPDGQNIWGATYMEVDLTEQHIWFIVNGQVALETDVITGTKGVHDTPTGVFNILEKQKNRVLRGRPGPDGKPIYLQPVDYWMRVTWSGIGFHDAGYRPVFNPQQYLTHGSHGCINMPPAKAAELYNILPMGTPVVIHY